MVQLSENNIKAAALRFLKGYYRFRPRIGSTSLRVNLRGEGGLVIDGQLSFLQDENKPFVATVEATSYLTREEVRYSIDQERLGWDATVFGLILVAGLLVFWRDEISVPIMGGLAVWIGYTAVAALLLHVLFRLLFRRLRRYRYIYAVAQFKRYFADEQWIAIGEDVFPSSEDPFFQELREQCIFNGLGLLIVDQHLKVEVHISPSRIDLFNQKRKNIAFFSLEELTQRLQDIDVQGSLQRWRRWFPVLPPWVKPPNWWIQMDKDRLLRFRRRFWHQMAICSACVLLISTVLFLEMLEKPILYVDEEDYVAEMEEVKSKLRREEFGYQMDSASLLPYRPRVFPYLYSGDSIPLTQLGPLRLPPGLIAFEGEENGYFEYACERLELDDRPRYIILMNRYRQPNPLRSALIRLQERQVEALGVWTGCFTDRLNEYLLFLRRFYYDRSEAQEELPEIEAELKAAGFSAKLEILELKREFN